ncbi:phosphotransferase enzyme family protein [Kribbella deserti]|uniref:Phosphotransferase enzyme family protein n=1 Tax=Kribbella deserti TaxID=1926257 RepID=A0ABV6QQA9_9ACTN
MFPTGLSMLWESADPREALRERFSLDDFDDAVAWMSKGLAEAWGINVETCDRIIISDTNAIAWVGTDRGALIAKWSRAQDQFERLEAIADLLKALHDQGMPVAPPLASLSANQLEDKRLDGRHRLILHSGQTPLSMTVQPQIDGELLDITDEAVVRQAGACLATLHNALADHADPRLADPKPTDDLGQQIQTWLEREDAGRAPDASARLRDQIASLPPIDRETQFIHRDYRSSNILTAGSEVLAIIDFDGVVTGYCINDLAFAFVYIGTRFRSWAPTPAYVREALLDGYQSVRPLTQLEHKWLQAVVLWYGIGAIPPGDDPAGWAAAI